MHQSPRSEPAPTPDTEETELSRFAASQQPDETDEDDCNILQQPLNIFGYFDCEADACDACDACDSERGTGGLPVGVACGYADDSMSRLC